MSMSNTTMATRRLGRSDLQVSALGMGCWAIGGAMASGDQPLGYSGVDDDEARLALERAVERGVTLFDTADAYGAGHSERLLAPVLAHHPEVLVATKFGNTIDEDRRQLTGRDTTPDYMRKALEGSLRRLSRDQIELYQLHVSDVDDSQALDLVAALEEVVAEGLVRWYGISTDDPTRVDLFATGPHCTAVQLQLNVFDDNPAALAACDRHDLAALCCPRRLRPPRPCRPVPLTARHGPARRTIQRRYRPATRRHSRLGTRLAAMVHRRPAERRFPGSDRCRPGHPHGGRPHACPGCARVDLGPSSARHPAARVPKCGAG
jgi:diketogulonate reductase-like aldo/keto reductase